MAIHRHAKGFTLIELIAVIALISIMLFFAVPKFPSYFTDNTKKTARYILLMVKTLKQNAVRDQQRYVLHVDFNQNRFWYEDKNSNKGEFEDGSPKEFLLPEDVSLVDVEFPDNEEFTYGDVEICFYKKGYSDKAIIHIEDKDANDYSFVIEPFLPRVKMIEAYVSFDDLYG